MSNQSAIILSITSLIIFSIYMYKKDELNRYQIVQGSKGAFILDTKTQKVNLCTEKTCQLVHPYMPKLGEQINPYVAPQSVPYGAYGTYGQKMAQPGYDYQPGSLEGYGNNVPPQGMMVIAPPNVICPAIEAKAKKAAATAKTEETAAAPAEAEAATTDEAVEEAATGAAAVTE